VADVRVAKLHEVEAFRTLWNTAAEPLRLLCSCAPPYSHDDTVTSA
jgi:hypothetical protein